MTNEMLHLAFFSMCCWFVFPKVVIIMNVWSIRVELSEVEFLDLSQTNHCESICQGLLSLINNESEWDRRRSDTVCPCATSGTASEARPPSETRDLA